MADFIDRVKNVIADPFTLEVSFYEGDLDFVHSGDGPITIDQLGESLEAGLRAQGKIRPLAYGRMQFDKDTVIILDKSLIEDGEKREWIRDYFFTAFETANEGRTNWIKLLEAVGDLISG